MIGCRHNKNKKPKSFDLDFLKFGAGNEIRTRDPNLGNLGQLFFAKYPYFTLNNLFIYQYLMIIIRVNANYTL